MFRKLRGDKRLILQNVTSLVFLRLLITFVILVC